PRVMVGPVAHAYAHEGALAKRLGDADLAKVAEGPSAPWEASYTAKLPPPPPLEIRGEYPPSEKRATSLTFEIRSTKAIGPVTVEALDHRRVAFTEVTNPVGASFTRFTLPFTKPRRKGAPKDEAPDEIDGIRVRVGDTRIELLRPHGGWKEEEAGAAVEEVFG